MLRISRLADYGTMVMSQMAGHPGRVFSATDLAASLGLGRATVSKVLKSLARRELVAGVRGGHGGYTLAREPQRITVADIVDAFEEQPFGLTDCSATSGACDIENSCQVRVNWQKISLGVRSALEGVTLAEMVQPQPLERPVVLHARRPAATGRCGTTTGTGTT